jgi:hypothetical protein
MTHEKFIQSVVALSGIIVVLILTVVTYMSLIGQPVNTSTEASGNPYYYCDNSCNKTDTKRKEMRRKINGVWFKIKCEQKPRTSQFIWTCTPQQ